MDVSDGHIAHMCVYFANTSLSVAATMRARRVYFPTLSYTDAHHRAHNDWCRSDDDLGKRHICLASLPRTGLAAAT